jgi:hypothetical protein
VPIVPFPGADPTPSSDGWCGWSINPAELCPDWATAYTEAQRNAALDVAVTVMWAATGRRYGPCRVALRPCQSQWWVDQYRAFPVWWSGPGYAGPFPFLFNGEWFNSCGCGGWCCCRARCEIVLPGPVDEIEEVLVNGTVLDASEYRLDVSEGQYRLVKLSSGCWPTCQDFNANVDSPNTFQIIFTRGKPVPDSVITATEMLACELVKQMVGAACALPPRMQSLTRQGVSAEFIVSQIDVDTFQTGVQIVDMVIRAQNPSRRTRPPLVLSPDAAGARDRMTVIESL